MGNICGLCNKGYVHKDGMCMTCLIDVEIDATIKNRSIKEKVVMNEKDIHGHPRCSKGCGKNVVLKRMCSKCFRSEYGMTVREYKEKNKSQEEQIMIDANDNDVTMTCSNDDNKIAIQSDKSLSLTVTHGLDIISKGQETVKSCISVHPKNVSLTFLDNERDNKLFEHLQIQAAKNRRTVYDEIMIIIEDHVNMVNFSREEVID